MKFTFATNEYCTSMPVRIGNIYQTRGGNRASRGDFWVLVGISESGDTAYLLAISREGRIVGSSSYGMHVVRDWSPIAFANGLEDVTFDVVSI